MPSCSWIRTHLLGRAPISADVAAALVFTSLFTMAVWLHVDHVGVPLLVAAFAALALAPHLPVPPAVGGQPPPTLNRWDLLCSLPIAAIIMLPIAWQLVMTRNEEFPWSGDHFFHLFSSEAFRLFWLRHAAPVGVFAAGVVVLHRIGVRYWAVIAFAAVLIMAFYGGAPTSAARYPSSAYFVEIPLRLLTHAAKLGDPPLTVDRLSIAASVPVWLFVLRPLVLRRWPDLSVLPFALCYFWQKDIVYWTGSVALEPWSIVFVLVAVELVLSELRYRTWLAPLLVGVAATFKEPAILLLPWIVLAGAASLPRTRRAWAGCALNAFLAALPFLIYYKFRTATGAATGVERTFKLADGSQIFSTDRFAQLAERMRIQFGATGLVLLALSLAIVVAIAWRCRTRRWVLLCLLGAIATQVAFFYVDGHSVPWTGYPRFHMIALAILAVAAWAPIPSLQVHRRFRRLAGAAAILIGFLQTPTLLPYLGSLSGADPTRNYVESADACIYYPIRELVDTADAAGAIAPGETIWFQHTPLLNMLELIYPALAERHPLRIVSSDCQCTAERRALLVTVDYPTGLLSKPGGIPPPEATGACIAALRSSYQQVFERDVDGYPTGLLGAGCK